MEVGGRCRPYYVHEIRNERSLHVAQRRGDIVVDYSVLAGAFEVRQSVRFTEHEFSQLWHVSNQGMTICLPRRVANAQVQTQAHSLWPTGTLDSMAMRELGPMAVNCLVYREYVVAGSWFWWEPLTTLAYAIRDATCCARTTVAPPLCYRITQPHALPAPPDGAVPRPDIGPNAWQVDGYPPNVRPAEGPGNPPANPPPPPAPRPPGAGPVPPGPPGPPGGPLGPPNAIVPFQGVPQRLGGGEAAPPAAPVVADPAAAVPAPDAADAPGPLAVLAQDLARALGGAAVDAVLFPGAAAVGAFVANQAIDAIQEARVGLAPPPGDNALRAPPGLRRPVDAMGMPAPNMTPEESARPDHAIYGHDADDAILRMCRMGRTVNREHYLEVVGGSVDPRAPVVVEGALLAFTWREPNCYSRNEGNVLLGIRERIERRGPPCDLTPADKRCLQRCWQALQDRYDEDGGVDPCAQSRCFTVRRIEAWAASHTWVDIKSRKWSSALFIQAFEQAIGTAFPRFFHETMCKVENTGEGKAPRPLIADGILGQMYALASIACLEDLMFDMFECESIKHRDKELALQDTASRLGHVGARPAHEADVGDADGSRWDSRCSADLRKAAGENQHIDHISYHLARLGWVPWDWCVAHSRSNHAARLNLHVKRPPKYPGCLADVNKSLKKTIAGIRRSGHRGTSCLNFLLNKTLNAFVFFGEHAHLAMAPRATSMPDRWGNARRYAAVFEGDDSIFATSPRLSVQQKYDVAAAWERTGHEIKLNWRNTNCGPAVFVGNVFTTTPYGLGKQFAPEIPRAFANGASLSTETKQACRDGNVNRLRELAASIALARAHAFAPVLPTLAGKYLAFAEDCGIGRIGYEEKMQIQGHDGDLPHDFVDRIRARMGTPWEEKQYLAAIGKLPTPHEWCAFVGHNWTFQSLRCIPMHRMATPACWREEGVAAHLAAMLAA